MARRRRKTRRRRRRNPTTAQLNPRRRRSRARSNPSRSRRGTRRRRRRNPGIDLMGTIIAMLGGAVIGAGAYALEGQGFKPTTGAIVKAGGGAVLGAAAGMLHKGLGAGIAGGGMALGILDLMRHFIESKPTTTSGLGRIPNYAYRTFGRTPEYPRYYHLPQTGAVQADLRGMRAVQADLRGVRVAMR